LEERKAVRIIRLAAVGWLLGITALTLLVIEGII